MQSRLLAVVDPSPLPKGRRLTQAEQDLARRDLTPERQAVLYEQLGWLCNQIIHTSDLQLPREVRRCWDGTINLSNTSHRNGKPRTQVPETRSKR